MAKFLRPAGSERLLASPSDCVFKNCYSVCSSVILSLKTSYSVFVNVLLDQGTLIYVQRHKIF